MAYPFAFHRLVLGGTLFTNETFNTSLSIMVPDAPAVDESLLEAVAAAIAAWWPNTGVNGVQSSYYAALEYIKLNRINTSGRYADPTAMTYDYPTPVAGGLTFAFAPQLSCVATLRTDFERGRAHVGRMFLPAPKGYDVPSTDGLATGASALRVANSVATLINSIHDTYRAEIGAGDFSGSVAIFSDVGAGTWHSVTSVTVGRVIDTMRSRRASLTEGYVPATVAIA